MAWETPQNYHQLGAAIEILSRSSPGSNSIIALIRLGWLFLQTEISTARPDSARAATPRSKYARKEAGAGPGGREELIEGNIGDWKLLKKMEIKKREKNEAVTSRAKTKTKRVASTRSGAGGAVSASGVAQRAGVCFESTRDFTVF